MKILVPTVFVGLLGLNAWLFLIRPKKPWTERISFVFQLVGIYTLALGVLAQTDIFKGIGGIGSEMTSPNLLEFAAGNLAFLGIILVIFSYALSSKPGFLESVMLLLFYTPTLLAYAVFHLMIIMPLAYIPYVIASVPIDAILQSTTDFTLSRGGSSFQMKAFVAENAVSLKSFLVAVPALVLAVSSKMLTLYKRNKS
jgi:hypothetical protein